MQGLKTKFTCCGDSGTNMEKKNKVALFPSEKKPDFPVYIKNEYVVYSH